MSLLEADLGEGQKWCRVGAGYEVTKKPRRLDRVDLPAIPCRDGRYLAGRRIPADFTMKAPEAIASGTYFERGDILVENHAVLRERRSRPCSRTSRSVRLRDDGA